MSNYAKMIFDEVNKSLKGKEKAVKKAVVTLAAGGHLLLEDVPGVGKTTLSKALAAAAGLETKRVQFTPDTLPSDITGFTLWDAASGQFRFHSGAVMTNILLADEINRTSPRTQAALLQAMEENCVSEDGKTYELESPFMVIATQNPYGSAGTMPLPNSQLDRFMMKISLGRPTQTELSELLLHRAQQPKTEINAVCGREEVLKMQADCDKVFFSQPIAEWLAALIEATNCDENVAQGVSPRGTIAMMKAAKAMAYFDERDYVLPADIAEIFTESAAHRLVLTPNASAQSVKADEICTNILENSPPPHMKGKKK